MAPLISNLPFAALLADQAFDSDGLLRELQVRGATAVIPPKANRKEQRAYDKEAYKWRHLIENFFARIKEYRGSATRYDKTDSSYAANWNLVCNSQNFYYNRAPGKSASASRGSRSHRRDRVVIKTPSGGG